MESKSLLEINKVLKMAGVKFVDQTILERVLENSNANTIHKTLLRLTNGGVIKRISNGKYMVTDMVPDDFEIANYVISPSYISFETALSYYGILPQFTYSITSATLNKSNKILFDQKEMEYTTLNKNLYWGYVKVKEFLIASPEKAAIDTIYMTAKGLRRTDVNEWDWTAIDKPKFIKYSKIVTFTPFKKFINANNLI